MTTPPEKTTQRVGRKAALDASRINYFSMRPETLVLVEDKASAIYDPRVHLPVKESLVLSVMRSGVIKAVQVRKNGPDVEVVDGKQRVEAAVEANRRLRKLGKPLVQVHCYVRRGEDDDLFGLMMAANEHDQKDSALVRAKNVARFIELGGSEADAAIHFGVHVATIKNTLKLLDCGAPVQKAVEEGRITVSDAVGKLAQMPRDEQVIELKRLEDKNAHARAVGRARGSRAAKPHAGVSKARLRKVLAAIDEDACAPVSREGRAILAWVVGEIDDEQLLRDVPTLRHAVEGRSSGKPNGVAAEVQSTEAEAS